MQKTASSLDHTIARRRPLNPSSAEPPAPPAAEARPASGLPSHKLQRVFTLIDGRLAETLHVRELADAVSLSPFHFARMFKKSTGHSPHAFITLRRMEFAKRLLADESISLLEVGTRAGYQTQAHFTDVFRKQVGMTPGRFRRQCIEDRMAAAAALARAASVPASPASSPSQPAEAQ